MERSVVQMKTKGHRLEPWEFRKVEGGPPSHLRSGVSVSASILEPVRPEDRRAGVTIYQSVWHTKTTS